MANKIKCTCGHSWDKSDSSKKDAYICHICGKDTRSDVPKAQVGEEVPAQKITPEMIQGWGEYRNYLDKQGLYGDPRLNTGFGKKTFVDWATKNPNYGVNWETLPVIGQELSAHKQKVKEAVGRGKVSLSTPVSEFNASDVTNAKSKNPWWPGTEFTAQEFAEYEEKILDPKGKVVKEKQFGVLPSTEDYDKLRLDKEKVTPISGVKPGALPNKKNGGWLDKYADDGGEYLGTTNKGFNYNGAWGGPSMQNGGVFGKLTFLEPTSKKLPEGYNPKAEGYSTEYATSIGGGDGEPAYLIPTFKYGKLLDDPETEFRRTGEHLGGPFKTYQEAEEWERTVRHPYVEKGQSIPTPIKRSGKDFAMGGSLPGPTGMMYGRMQGGTRTIDPAPANGKYTKKTKASAQNGAEMSFYQNGLDWKPRNISRDGAWLDKYDAPQAQMGTMVTPLNFSKPIGTLEGVSEVMSAPARTATYLLTGKYQDPSQALGIKNPIGAFVTDAILDPVNLLGVGAAGKVGKAAKAAVKASKKSGALSKAYKLNPWAFKADPDAYYRMLGKEGYEDALQSGKFGPKKGGSYNEAYYSKGYPLDKVVYPKVAKEKGLLKNASTYEGPYMAEVKGQKELFSNPLWTASYSGPDVDFPIQYSLNDIPLSNPNVNIYKQDWLKGYKKVKPPKKKEEGGEITKDDNGYWNPDNWGEPVEIGSNNITMQGVNQPLIGVSDTGDTQMMYPGEDYEFDGETVTEYPVAQKGEKIPITVSDRNDPRLRAYNDSLKAYQHFKSLYNKGLKTGIIPHSIDGNVPVFSVADRQYLTRKQAIESDYDKYVNKLGLKLTRKDVEDQYKRIDIIPGQVKNEAVGYYRFKHKNDPGYYTLAEYKKPVQPVEYRKPEPKKEQPPIKKTEQPKPIERKQNVYEGSPVYSPGTGSGMPSALIGFANQKGDTTYIKPEDYERFAVPKYGKEYIESKTTKKKNGGWLEKYK